MVVAVVSARRSRGEERDGDKVKNRASSTPLLEVNSFFGGSHPGRFTFGQVGSIAAVARLFSSTTTGLSMEVLLVCKLLKLGVVMQVSQHLHIFERVSTGGTSPSQHFLYSPHDVVCDMNWPGVHANTSWML